MVAKLDLPIEDIIHQYIGYGISCYELAGRYGCSTGTVKRRLLAAGVGVRNCKGAQNTNYTLIKKKDCAKKLNLPVEEIITSYVDCGIGRRELGRKYGCTQAPILRILKDNDVIIRNNDEAHNTAHFRLLIKKPKLMLPEFDIILDYTEKGMGTKDLAQKYKCNHVTIKRVLTRNGYAVRTAEEARNTLYSIAKRRRDRIILPIDNIIESYIEDGIGMKEIATIYGCSDGAIKRRLLKNKVVVRSNKETGVTSHTRNKLKRINRKQLQLESNEIRRKYVELGQSAKDIAVECLCDGATIIKRLGEMGIEIRDAKEAMKMPKTAEKIRLAILHRKKVDFVGKNNPFYGKSHTPDVKAKLRLNTIRQWSNAEKRDNMRKGRERWRKSLTQEEKDDYARRRLCGLRWRINKSESYLYSLLHFIYPNDWKFVGNGQFIIGGKCPDFINVNGKKQIIELFGDYWHRNDNGNKRKGLFAEYGYSTLIIWESELRKPQRLIKKITEFAEEKVEASYDRR